jgi:nickel transport protein
MKRIIFILLAAVLPALFLSSTAMAHRVNVFAYVKNGTVYVEGYFLDGRPVTDGKIEVTDSKGQIVFSGNTDEKGKLSFPVPITDDLAIVLNASMGHRNQFLLKKNTFE